MKTLNLADAEGSRAFAEFDPQTVLRDWGNGEGFRLLDALTGVCVFGATGSGLGRKGMAWGHDWQNQKCHSRTSVGSRETYLERP